MAKKQKFNLLSGYKPGEMSAEYQRNFLYYKNIAMNVYEWRNLPNGIESRHIERALFESGQAFFFDDKVLGFMCLPCHPSSSLNVYNDPQRVQVHGMNYVKELNIKDGVRILNNDTAIPTLSHVDFYSEKLARIEQIIDQNLEQQRFPLLFRTSKNSEFSAKQMFNQIKQGLHALFVDKDMIGGGGNIEVLNTDVPFLADKLHVQLENYRKELLTFLGINSSIEKKERLLVDEVNSNNDYINLSLTLGLKCRQLAAKQINEKFGLTVEVGSKVDDLKREHFNQLSRFEREEGDDESLYDRTSQDD